MSQPNIKSNKKFRSWIKLNTLLQTLRSGFSPSIQPAHVRLQTILFETHFPNLLHISAQIFSTLFKSYKTDIAFKFLTKLLNSLPSL